MDAHTAFEIVSIDIADIDIGENIGARLQADQAEADMRKAQALAEQRRANAIAREQEMKAVQTLACQCTRTRVDKTYQTNEVFEGLGHFGPLQDPARVAATVRRAFTERG